MTKRMFSFALCLLMVAQLCIFASTDVQASAREITTEEDLKFLNAVGICDTDYADITLGEKITRLDFAVAVARIFGNSASLGEEEPRSRYSDMASMGAEAVKAVNLLSDLKIISGTGNGEFQPYSNISYEQAVKIMVCALGYEIVALQNGGYPLGYFAQGATLGITDGISLHSTDYLNWESFIRLLSNSLFVDLMENADYGSVGEYTIASGDTLLNTVMDIYVAESALITANSITSLGGAAVKTGYVEINKLLFKDPHELAAPYIGKQADVYYTEAKNGERSVVYVDADYELLKISADDITQISGYRITYYDDRQQKEVTANIAVDAVMLINGQALYYTPSLIDLKLDGVITLERSGTAAYSVVRAELCSNMIAAAVDYEQGIVYDKIVSGNSIKLKSFIDEERCIVYKNGEETDIHGIESGALLSVYQSPDNTFVTVKVSSESVSGTISSFSEDTVSIDGNEYKYAASAAEELRAQLGNACTAYINEYGKIVYFTVSSADVLKYGYVIAAKTGGTLDKSLKLRILTQDDEIKDFVVADKVEVDNAAVKDNTAETVSSYLGADANVQQLIQYAVNNDGEIRLINTVKSSGIASERYRYDGISCFLEKGSYKYKSTKATFSGRVTIDSNTKIFVVSPSGAADVDDYQLRTPSYFTNDNAYTVAAYNADGGGRADVLVCWNEINDFSSVSIGGRLVMVDYITQTVAEDGDEVQKLYGLSGSSYVSYITDGDTELSTGTRALKRGDIVNLAFNSKNEICYVSTRVNIDTQRKSNFSVSASSAWNTSWAISGAFYSMEGNNALISKTTVEDLDTIFEAPDFDNMYSVALTSNIMIYDEAADAVYPGTAADILTYKTAGGAASRFYMRFYNDTLNTIFIFKYAD